MGVLDTLDNASTGTRTCTLILDAALAAEWESLVGKLEKAAASDDQAVVDGEAGSLAMPATTKIVNRMEELREAVEASQVDFSFAPMDWTERIALQATHPPRKGNLIDQLRGFNVTTFMPALIRSTCIRVKDAAGDETTDVPAKTWDHLLGHPGDPDADPPVEPVKPTLNYGQVSKLYRHAADADEGETRVPTSARFLLETQDSGASLAQPSPGKVPLRNGSEGGSRPGSVKSSTGKKAAAKKAASSGS